MNTDIIMIEKLVEIAKKTMTLNYPINKSDLIKYMFELDPDKNFEELELFEICHELGKICLNLANYHSATLSDIQLANRFAARFLLPSNLFIETAEKFMNNGMVNCTKMAKYYSVSINTIVIRGMELNLW